MRPGIDVHDYDFKIKAAEKFIGQGDKVKFTIRFKGREFEHHDIAESLMGRIREKMEVVSKIELRLISNRNCPSYPYIPSAGMV